jgi:hypothetical protein
MSARDSTFRASIGSLIHLSIDQEKYQHDWPALVLFRLPGGLYQASLLAFSKDRKTSRTLISGYPRSNDADAVLELETAVAKAGAFWDKANGRWNSGKKTPAPKKVAAKKKPAAKRARGARAPLSFEHPATAFGADQRRHFPLDSDEHANAAGFTGGRHEGAAVIHHVIELVDYAYREGFITREEYNRYGDALDLSRRPTGSAISREEVIAVIREIIAKGGNIEERARAVLSHPGAAGSYE